MLPACFQAVNYIKWGFESRLKQFNSEASIKQIISNGDLRVD